MVAGLEFKFMPVLSQSYLWRTSELTGNVQTSTLVVQTAGEFGLCEPGLELQCSADVVRSGLLDISIYQLFWEPSSAIREEGESLKRSHFLRPLNNCHETHGFFSEELSAPLLQ